MPDTRTIEEFIAAYLLKKVERCNSLVVYDPAGLYQAVATGLCTEDILVVDGSSSTIEGRERAMAAWRQLADDPESKKRLLVYVPARKPRSEEEQRKDPYQIFVLGGGVFPESDGETFQALCHKACPELVEPIDQLFAAGVPDFATLNNLAAGGVKWPKLRTLLKRESAAEILVAFLCPDDAQKDALGKDASWVPEIREFAQTALGLQIKTRSQKWTAISEEMWRYILFSEFAYDLPRGLPEEMKDVPRAPGPPKDLVYTVCETLRESERYKVSYMDTARQVASTLDLEGRMTGVRDLGCRDTFAFEERRFLAVFAEALLADEMLKATAILAARQRSVWVKHEARRQTLWTVASRALHLLEAIQEMEPRLKGLAKGTAAMVTFYAEAMRQVDRRHREFEQAVADTYGELDDVADLVAHVRSGYRYFAERVQERFVDAVKNEGWPVAGFTRNTQVFDRFVAPWLKDKVKTAFFMVDALRYELGVELEASLASAFSAEVHAVCAQLPTITRVGMAALLPEADGQFEVILKGDHFVPKVRGVEVETPKDRLDYMAGFYGDRCQMVDLNDLVLKKSLRVEDKVDLLVVKTTDIDTMGEISPVEARQMLPKIVNKIIAGANKACALGFTKIVIATDHGYALLEERESGDVAEKPAGDWVEIKDRCLLGRGSSNAGTVAFTGEDVGIRGQVDNYVVPRSFATFIKGRPYFHEGLSLQECVLPVLVLSAVETRREEPGGIELRVTYKGGTSAQVTARRPMIELSLYKTGLFQAEAIEFQLEARSKNKVVGEAGTCDSLNPATNLITMRPGDAIKVPLRMDEDFQGAFEVRATDPATGIHYGTLKLKTNYMD